MSETTNVDYTNRLIDRLFFKLGSYLFSWKTRRRIFLSTIYGMSVDQEKTDFDHADKLAKVLNLSRDHKALELPMAIKSVVWFKKDKELVVVETRKLFLKDIARKDLSEKEQEELACSIVNNTPWIIRYAKYKQMVYDVKCLSNYLRASVV